MKVTADEKQQLDNLASKDNQTLKEIILNGTIYSNKEDLQKEIDQLERSLTNMKEAICEIDGLQSEIKRLADLTEAKDGTITTLEEQLQQANLRIDDYSRQLENQQSLQLASVQTNKDLQHKLESLEQKEEQEQKGFWSRLFSND